MRRFNPFGDKVKKDIISIGWIVLVASQVWVNYSLLFDSYKVVSIVTMVAWSLLASYLVWRFVRGKIRGGPQL